MTPANIDDGRACPDALPDNPGDVYADSAYRGDHFGQTVLAKGGTPRIVATGMWGRDEAEVQARLEERNITNRSIASAGGSRKSSGRGNAAMATTNALAGASQR